MTFRTRMILLFIFILLFLITAPIVVLYTAGYHFSLDNNGIVRTGLFYVTSLPKGANISLDENERGSTPGFVKNLIPREYDLTINKEGYHAWSKTLPINSHETTFVEDIILFLNTEPTITVSAEIIESVVDPTKSTLAYITSSASWLELWTFEPASNQQSLLYRFTETETIDIKLAWSVDGERLLVAQTENDQITYSIIDKSGNSRFEISSLIEEEISQAWWHPSDPLAILFKTDQETYVYRLSTQSLNQIYDQPRLATLMEGQAILIDTSGNTVSVFRYIDETATLLAYLPAGDYQLLAAAEPLILLEETSRDQLVLIDTSRDSQPILLSVYATGQEWSPDGSGRLLYFNDFEIHIYDPANHTDELLTRVGESITSAAWHPSGNAVLGIRSDILEAIELDSRDQRNMIELTQGQNLTSLFVTENGREAYFVGEVNPDRGLFNLELQRR